MKVRVRIAVAVGKGGEWNACGNHTYTDADAFDVAIGGLDLEQWREAIVVADIDIPDLSPVEFEGQQEPASETATA